MIVIKIEMWPKGDEKLKRSLGKAIICNDGKGTLTKGNYKCIFYKKGRSGKVYKETNVKLFPRKRLLVWDLLYRCLKNIVGGRN